MGRGSPGTKNAWTTTTSWIRDLAFRLVYDRSGVTAVEYGLMIAAIAAAIIGVVFLIGGQIEDLFLRISNKMAQRSGGGFPG